MTRTTTARAERGLPPARFLRRYAAWSLDATALGIAACACTWSCLRTGLDAARAALDAMSDAMAHALFYALVNGQSLLVAALTMVHDPALLAAITSMRTALWASAWPPLLAYAAFAAGWHVAFERSRWQASPGKRALGLVVTRHDGGRLTVAQALPRHLTSALSWLTLNIGHLMALAPPLHQALHDRVSGTRVQWTSAPQSDGMCNRTQSSDDVRLPAWAKAWLLLQMAAGLVAAIWLATTADASMQSALQRALGA